MRIQISNVISYLVLSSIFLIGIPIRIGVDFYWFYPIYILFILYSIIIYRRISLNLLLILLLLFIYSLLTYKYGLPLVIKQLINISFSALVFYYFIVHEKFDAIEIFKKYIVLAKIIAVIGLIQVVMFAFGFGNLYVSFFPWLKEANIGLRLQSICQEPSFVSLTLAPVVYFAVYNFFNKTSLLIDRGWSLSFILTYVLTQSSVAIIGLFAMLMVVYFQAITTVRLFFVIFFLMSISFFSYLAYNNIEFFRVRLNDTYEAFGEEFIENSNYKKVNLSTYALISNVYVTEKALNNYPLTGSGLGTHELTYIKYLPSELQRYMILNSEDANSMGLRLLSETGLIGFSIFVYFVFKNRISFKSDMAKYTRILWVFNSGILIFLLLCVLRNGNYTIHGKVLFLLLLYYTHKTANQNSNQAI